jgi:flagellar protein FliL
MKVSAMSKEPNETPVPKSGMKKKLILGVSILTLLSAGVGAGVYLSGSMIDPEKAEDVHRPKLVERSAEPAEPVEGGDEKDIPLKVGTVSVANDRFKVDPKKYEITYYPLEQNFTANLADGSGFVQIGISLATYYDGTIISNIKRQTVPIRSAVLMVLSEQDPILLSTAQGKLALQQQLTKAINAVLRDKEGFGGVDSVYFSNLVIQ